MRFPDTSAPLALSARACVPRAVCSRCLFALLRSTISQPASSSVAHRSPTKPRIRVTNRRSRNYHHHHHHFLDFRAPRQITVSSAQLSQSHTAAQAQAQLLHVLRCVATRKAGQSELAPEMDELLVKLRKLLLVHLLIISLLVTPTDSQSRLTKVAGAPASAE